MINKEVKNSNYYCIDILKLFFSMCIVALHTHLFLDINVTLHWYSSHCIWRIAVIIIPLKFTLNKKNQLW